MTGRTVQLCRQEAQKAKVTHVGLGALGHHQLQLHAAGAPADTLLLHAARTLAALQLLLLSLLLLSLLLLSLPQLLLLLLLLRAARGGACGLGLLLAWRC
jgi:hypothetical protein